jgi:hypothetical protein
MRNFVSDVSGRNSVAKQGRRQPIAGEVCRYRGPGPCPILELVLIGCYEWVGVRDASARSASARSRDICMRLPDFNCIGAQKAGTTWLYEQLLGHPDVFMPKKELDFFFQAARSFVVWRAF